MMPVQIPAALANQPTVSSGKFKYMMIYYLCIYFIFFVITGFPKSLENLDTQKF